MPTEELTLGDKKVILVGTAHVSDESVKAVEEAIETYKPDAVAVELCEQRWDALRQEKEWEETDIMQVISSDRMYLFLLQILLTNFQRKIGDEVGVKPGSEMIKAMEISQSKGIKVVLADRDIKVTLRRAMDLMTLKEKVKLLYSFITGIIEGEEIDKELVERLKEKDVLTELMEELAVETPSIKRVLVDERDLYIAHRIYMADAKCIVAVVGAGHMEGIKKSLSELDGGVVVTYTNQVDGVDIRRAKVSKIKLVTWAFPALLLLLFAWMFIQYGGSVTFKMIIKLFLLQGTFAALGVALALGHPLSILAAFLTAPFAALNPAIAVGWIAGYVELKLRKPRVVDFKNLMKLKGMSDYLSNRVVRVILIVTFANIGSMFGSFVGVFVIGLSNMI
ncbi:MAG: TraB/GumN family protein [Candidatus Altiarchaeota archaeon]